MLNQGLLFTAFERNEAGRIVNQSDFILYCVIFGAVLVFAYLFGAFSVRPLYCKIMAIENTSLFPEKMDDLYKQHGVRGFAWYTLLNVFKIDFPIFLSGLLFGFQYVLSFSWNSIHYIVALLAIAGHLKSPYRHFHGETPFVALAAIALILNPIPFVILAVVFVLVLLSTKFVAASIIICSAFYPITLQAFMNMTLGENEINYNPFILLSAILLALIVVLSYRQNIRNLLDHKEPKFHFGRG